MALKQQLVEFVEQLEASRKALEVAQALSHKGLHNNTTEEVLLIEILKRQSVLVQEPGIEIIMSNHPLEVNIDQYEMGFDHIANSLVGLCAKIDDLFLARGHRACHSTAMYLLTWFLSRDAQLPMQHALEGIMANSPAEAEVHRAAVYDIAVRVTRLLSL